MESQYNILLIDDNVDQQFIFKKYFEKTHDNLITAGDGNEGLNLILQKNIDLIILDYMMPAMNGYKFMSILASNPLYRNVKSIPVIMLSSLRKDLIPQDDLRKMGVDLFLSKPFSFQELFEIIENLVLLHSKHYHHQMRIETLEQENNRLKSQLKTDYDFSNIIAISSKMRTLLEKLKKHACTNAHIFLFGAPGTEKEIIASALHFNSDRAKNPFIPFHGNGLQNSLLENLLFGYKENSFPVSTQSSNGLLKKADRGTLYLCDFNTFNERLQSKIIHFLLTNRYQKSNSVRVASCDTRVIIGIDNNISENTFMNNLRINFDHKRIFKINIPRLNERKDDIAPMVLHFLNKYKKQKNMKFSNDSINILEQYSWPGNVNELETVIRGLVESLHKSTILPEDLPQDIRDYQAANNLTLKNNLPLKEARKKWISQFEKAYLQALLSRCNGNISKVAKYAKVNRMTIYRLLNTYNIYQK